MASAPFILTQSRDLSMKKILVASLELPVKANDTAENNPNYFDSLRDRIRNAVCQLTEADQPLSKLSP
jgi:hypothetical protein